MNVLVTGSSGFIGKNLLAFLANHNNIITRGFDIDDDPAHLPGLLGWADSIIHLAGVNRPLHPEEYEHGNTGFSECITKTLGNLGKTTTIILASSIQAALDNPYGKSKRGAERCIEAYAKEFGASAYIFRLPNVFGKWCRPHYNSAVATFCYLAARKQPISIHDPSAPLHLVYIDDVMEAFRQALQGQVHMEHGQCAVPESYQTTVGEVAHLIQSFHNSRQSLYLPLVSDGLGKKLFATFLSYLPEDEFSYPLSMHEDNRGSFTELLRTPERGQVSVNISRPGITKGNHWHHTKHEKFIVVRGQAAIKFRKVGTMEVLTYQVSGNKLEAIDIPPGYTHNITNLGDDDLVTVMWVNEPYDPNHPDTWPEEV